MNNATSDRGLAVRTRDRILHLLRVSGRPMEVYELAAGVGRFPTTVRAHLDRLVAAGLVNSSTAPATGRGRPALRYAADLDAAASAEDARPYARLAAALAAQLASLPDPAAAANEAGQRWGRAIAADMPRATSRAAAIESLVAILDAAGFAPEAHAEVRDDIRLGRCPFGQLGLGRGQVVCDVHLGLMQGAVAELGAPLRVVGLEPFVEPGVCVASIGAGPGN